MFCAVGQFLQEKGLFTLQMLYPEARRSNARFLPSSTCRTWKQFPASSLGFITVEAHGIQCLDLMIIGKKRGRTWGRGYSKREDYKEERREKNITGNSGGGHRWMRRLPSVRRRDPFPSPVLRWKQASLLLLPLPHSSSSGGGGTLETGSSPGPLSPIQNFYRTCMHCLTWG